MQEEKSQDSSVYRPGSSAQAQALLPWVRSAAEALDIPIEHFDALATARHLAGLLEQSRIVAAQQMAVAESPALLFLP